MSWKQTFTEDLRLVILRALDQFGGASKSMSSSLLFKAIESIRHTATREEMLAELPWLAEIGAIRVEQIESTPLKAVTLLDLGERHVARKTRIAGVAVPSSPLS